MLGRPWVSLTGWALSGRCVSTFVAFLGKDIVARVLTMLQF
jgi:hypothetical protein